MFRQKTNACLASAIFSLAAISGTASPVIAQEAGSLFATGHQQLQYKSSSLQAERGLFFVPENRQKKDSRLIAVAYMRFPSTAEQPGTPIIWLAGGPGGSAISRFVGGQFNDLYSIEEQQTLNDLRSVADVIMVDQRGAHASLPNLICPNPTQDTPADRPTSKKDQLQSYKQYAATCKSSWGQTGHDIDGYQIDELTADVKAFADKMGFEKITLYGGSFGSQWSFAINHRYPELVEKMILWGIEDLNDTYDDPDAMLVALKGILQDVEQDATIAPFVPDGGFYPVILDRIAALEKNPKLVTVSNPKTGEEQSVHFGADELRGIWWQDPSGWRLGERAGSHLWADTLIAIVNEDYEVLAGRVAASKKGSPGSMTWSSALTYAVDCRLSPSRARAKGYGKAPAVSVIGDINLGYRGMCPEWGVKRPPSSFFDAPASSTPALFIHGTYDLSTPFKNATDAAQRFKNGHLLVVERSGHNPIINLYREQPETIRPIIKGFLKDPMGTDIPERVALPPVDYTLSEGLEKAEGRP